MSTFSDRLREERKRLGMNQTELAAAAGVQKQAQVNYEAGKRSPNADYLAALAAVGADVLYILTGQRSQPVPAEALLPVDERIMLDNYRHAPGAVQSGIKTTLGAFAPGAQVKGRSRAA